MLSTTTMKTWTNATTARTTTTALMSTTMSAATTTAALTTRAASKTTSTSTALTTTTTTTPITGGIWHWMNENENWSWLHSFRVITAVIVAERLLSFTMGVDFDPSFNSPSNELYQSVLSVVSSYSALTLKIDTKKQRSLKTVMLLTDPKAMHPTHSRTASCSDKRVQVSTRIEGMLSWSYCHISKIVNVCIVCVQTHKQKLEALCDLVSQPWFMVWMVHLWFGFQYMSVTAKLITTHKHITVKWSIPYRHLTAFFPSACMRKYCNRLGEISLKDLTL